MRELALSTTPSLAAGRLGCGWCETVVVVPVGYGDLLCLPLEDGVCTDEGIHIRGLRD